MAKVAILGGGVAGMTAAHELIERGFEVEVFEKRKLPGGKARSIPFPNTGTDGRPDLPGEHGFRFFPGFYVHLPDTMKRIPFGTGHSVYQNLVSTPSSLFSADIGLNFDFIPHFPTSWKDLKVWYRTPANFRRLKVPVKDFAFMLMRMIQIATSCRSRREQEYERLSWWRFVEADARSENYRRYLVGAATRTLVAAKAKSASARTIGTTGVRLVSDIVLPGRTADRLLDGPTNQVFIDPWLKHLKDRGVVYHLDAHVAEILFKNNEISGVVVERDGTRAVVEADYYISALPVNNLAPLITAGMIEADAQLGSLARLAKDVAWMNGMQFYLKQDIPIVAGHAAYMNTPWALTSVSQEQFWPGFKLQNFGDGAARGLISVDISDWIEAGNLYNKPAKDLTREEIAKEVWHELQRRLNIDGQVVLTDDNLHSWFIDPDITDRDLNPSKHANTEPLLVNVMNSWSLRPTARTEIPNFFISGDFVQTNTDLATMESANEAARRAVNALLEQTGSSAKRCRVWTMDMPIILAPWRWVDQWRFDRGLGWSPPFGFLFRWMARLGGRLLGVEDARDH